MYAAAGQVSAAQNYLKRLSAIGCWSDCLSTIQKEKLFETPEFKPILDDLRSRSSFWEGKALDTPYRENISVEEKVAGLSKFWSEVKYNFIFVDRLLEVDWDSQYLTRLRLRPTRYISTVREDHAYCERWLRSTVENCKQFSPMI
jgi:hypothetical protein